MTDGQENSSMEYSLEHFKTLKAEKEKAKWSFVFLGANQDAWLTAQQFGFAPQNVATFNSTLRGMDHTFTVLAANTQAYGSASGTSDAFFSQSDQNSLKNTK